MREGVWVAARPIGAHEAITATSASLRDQSRTASTMVGALAPAHSLSWQPPGRSPSEDLRVPRERDEIGPLAAMTP